MPNCDGPNTAFGPSSLSAATASLPRDKGHHRCNHNSNSWHQYTTPMPFVKSAPKRNDGKRQCRYALRTTPSQQASASLHRYAY